MVYWFTLVCLVARGGSIFSCQCFLLGINANNSSNKRLYWYAILFHFLILMGCSQCMLKDPKILLLDEATSALDAEGEHIVQDALNQVMVSRTTIVVAHRLSTFKGTDMIVVMNIVLEISNPMFQSVHSGSQARWRSSGSTRHGPSRDRRWHISWW
jgi:hypothetical protein